VENIGDFWQTRTLLVLVIIFISAFTTFVLILGLKPLLQRYALARPNARTSHRQPTPQGAGIAVIAITVVTIVIFISVFPQFDAAAFAPILIAVITLAVVGAVDDIRTLEAIPRLAIQFLAVLIVIVTLPSQHQILSSIPLWSEREMLFVALLWFVNLVNFMDGIDWMTVAEVVPVTAGLSLFGLMGSLPTDATVAAIALCGAMIGFSPFNRPVARLFLGDVGSLPIGLLLGWLLVSLAARGHLVAAILLPLYYLADATITLLLRLAGGEKVIQPHRRHFYQQALDGGLGIYHIVGRVFGLNILLVGLAAATLIYQSLWLQITALAAGVTLVALLILNFKSWHR
jgi:UDP-N-acetylmuramyl pentapeptide phosphotransferase/UDP-N-acetylglucosamine-1-phosphate transferase